MLSWIIIISLTLISGIGDAVGFVYAAKIWDAGTLVKNQLLKSAAGFIIGIGVYWYVIKFLNQKNVISAEIQTIYWFCTTMLGIAILSGRIIHWPLREKIVGLIAMICIGWLLYRAESL